MPAERVVRSLNQIIEWRGKPLAIMVDIDFLSASAASKIVNVACNLSALFLFSYTGHILWQAGVVMAVCNIVGSVTGTRLAITHGLPFVRRLFLFVVSALVLKTAYDAFLL